jgi:hypothetical protein
MVGRLSAEGRRIRTLGPSSGSWLGRMAFMGFGSVWALLAAVALMLAR